jgi:hypothetical protein
MSVVQHDIELGYADIQALSDADAVAAFFERLGYNTSIRRVQTPANLGITADSTLRPIKKIELLADQEGLLQIYLFELRSVTVAHTRAIANAFRLLAGNYLLVLTSDYERLDFVLLEREHPTGPGSGLGAPQVKVRPRTLTVERLKPERLHLRILRRFTFTEPDPFAQYEKLTAAYTVAAWSEEYFNNRALFSDHYLSERLREFPQWNEDAKPAWSRLRELYAGAAARFGGKDRPAIGRDLFEPIFGALGFRAVRGDDADGPSYLLYSQEQSGAAPLALCLVYQWDRMLDAKDYGRDSATPEANPGAQVVSLLERGDAPWVIVTNGRLWRLYSRRAHSRATNYYEIDLSDLLADQGPGPAEPGDAFRYFWLLFRRDSFVPGTVVREGREASLSLVDRILDESEEYARKLGENLKRRVFEDIFPLLAEGLVDFIHRAGARSLSQDALEAIFRGTLTLLYRLLFILYAEARDLLPVKETRGYFEVSLSRLKQEVADAAGPVRDEAAARLAKRYRADSFELRDRLAEMFAVIDRGRAALNVPVYNGGLFLSDPKDDASEEAQVSRFLLENKIADRFLAPALDLLARDEDPKSFKLVPIDFKSLGVRQLGSIYEGLLEFKLRVASEKLAIAKEKSREVYHPFKELSEAERDRAERQQRVIAKGRAYLENDRRERKATGSYYTPDHIVAYIVEQAVGPVVKEKFDALRPMLREAQAWHRDRIKNARATGEDPRKYESGPAVESKWRALIDQFFNIKVLDPAMGSGHFLVQAVDYITDKALDFLNGFPWNPVTAHLADVRESIVHEMDEQGITIDIRRLTDVNLLKRHVLKRCIYGVDLNPMAVELAKVSLWLDCFTLGAPLSFLDHHLRCGNSLIGVSVPEVQDELRQGSLFGNWFAGLTLATDFMRHVGELSDVTSAQVYESRAEYRKASDALAPYKRILDVYTSQWFGNEAAKKARGKGAAADAPVIAFLKTREADRFIKAHTAAALEKALTAMSAAERQIAETALAAAGQRRFFHWELEFPEVFYGPRPGTERVTDRLDDAGFDAVVGNPPYARVQQLRQSDPAGAEFVGQRYRSATKNFDIYLPFLEIGLRLTIKEAVYIVPNKWFATDYGAGLRDLVAGKKALARVVDFKDFQLFEDATNYTCVVGLSRKSRENFAFVDASTGEIGSEQDRPAPGSSGVWTFSGGAEAALLERLRGSEYPRLGEFIDRAFQGLRTSDNDVFVFRGTERVSKETVRVHSRATGSAHEIETELLKPLLSGDEIRAFSLSHNHQWILFPYDLSGSDPRLFSERQLKADFPRAWRYLRECETRLRAREQGRMDHSGWWAFGRSQNLDQFEQPKVMLPGYNDAVSAAFDEKGQFYQVSGYSLTLKDRAPISLALLTVLLNSRLWFWVLQRQGVALQRGFVEFRPQYLLALPVAAPGNSEFAELESLYKRAVQKGYRAIAPELDAAICRIYGISETEASIIGG